MAWFVANVGWAIMTIVLSVLLYPQIEIPFWGAIVFTMVGFQFLLLTMAEEAVDK